MFEKIYTVFFLGKLMSIEIEILAELRQKYLAQLM